MTLHSEIDPNDPWLGLNFLDPASRERMRRDPYPLFDNLRRVDPVHRTPIGVWRIARYADVLRVLRERRSACGRRREACRGWRRTSPTGARASSC